MDEGDTERKLLMTAANGAPKLWNSIIISINLDTFID